MQENEGDVPETWVHLRPTTPLRVPKQLDQAINCLADRPQATSLRSGHRAAESPFKWFQRDAEGFFEPLREGLSAEEVNEPRQDFPVAFIPDGYVDIVRASHVLGEGQLHGARMWVFESPRCTEVDEEEDFAYLEYQLERYGSPLRDRLQKVMG